MKYGKKNQIVESVQKLVHFPWSNWFDKITNSQTTKTTTDKQTNKQTKENQLRVWSYMPKQLNYVLSVCLFFCCFVCVCLFVCLFFYFLKVSECFYETNYREIMMNKNQKTYRPLRIHRSLPYFCFNTPKRLQISTTPLDVLKI